jgi:hypothetical protein
MTDLSSKFAALGTALGDKIDTLGGKLDALGTTLDAILTALTSASGNIDAAPIVTAIQALAGPYPGRTLTDLHSVVDSIKGSIGLPTGDATTSLLGRIYAIQYALTTNAPNAANLFGAVRAIDDALGGAPNSSLEVASVRGLLSALLFATQQSGILPDGTGYLTSDTTATISGRRFIVWPDLVDITESTDMVQLTPAAGWSGYSIYIQTSAPAAILHDFTTPAAGIDPFAVNSWVDLGGTDTLAFSVEASFIVKGYLRHAVSSANILVSERVSWGGAFYGQSIIWPSTYTPAPDSAYDSNRPNKIAAAKVVGTVTLVAGNHADIYIRDSGGASLIHALTAGASFALPSLTATQYIGIHSGDAAGDEFTISIS